MPASDPRAHSAVYRALKSGRLTRPDHCENCGAPCKPHAHHDDYSKPLDVRWLCAKCHRRTPLGVNAWEDGPAQFLVRLTDEQHTTIVTNAEKAGMSVNSYVLYAALGVPPKLSAEQQRVQAAQHALLDVRLANVEHTLGIDTQTAISQAQNALQTKEK